MTLLSVLGAKTALAAPTIALTTAAVTRYASDQSTPYGCPGRNSQTNSCLVDGTSQGIGFHDCIDDTVLKFGLTMTGVPDANYNLQVWAGTTDCTQQGATNNQTTGTCWPVLANPTPAVTLTLYVRVADIVSNLGQPAGSLPQTYSPTDAVTACDGAASSGTTTVVTDDAGNSTSTAGESTVTIYFMVFQNGQSTPTSTASYSVKVKLVGPNAVTNLTAGTGDGEIIASWTPPAGDTTVQGFNLYAVPEGTSLGDGGSQTVCSDAQAGTQLLDDAGNPVLDDAGNAVYVDDAGNPVSQDAGCTTTTNSSTATCSGTSGSVDVSSIACPSGGDAGGGAAVCQQVIGVTNSKGTITGLSNGTNYVVAVAAFDQFGNAGAVSTATCAAPAPIDDFWTVYNQDGGNAFCALEVVGKRGGGVAAALMSLVGLVWMRRRRSAGRRTERR